MSSNSATRQPGILRQLLAIAEASDDPADRALVPVLRNQIEEFLPGRYGTPDNGKDKAVKVYGLL